MLTFLQEHLHKFKGLRKDLTVVEMKTLNNLYIVTNRLAFENKKNSAFWNRFGKYYNELEKIIQKDLFDAVLNSGEKWDTHKKHLEDFLNSWTSHSAPLISDDTEHEFEGILIRKNMNVLQDLAKKFECKVGEVDLLSRQALITLLNRLEDVYFAGTKPIGNTNNSLITESETNAQVSLDVDSTNIDDWHFID